MKPENKDAKMACSQYLDLNPTYNIAPGYQKQRRDYVGYFCELQKLNFKGYLIH